MTEIKALVQVLNIKPLQYLALMHLSSASSRRAAPVRIMRALHNSSLRDAVESLHIGTTYNTMALLGLPNGLPRV